MGEPRGPEAPETSPGWSFGAADRLPTYALIALLLALFAGLLTYRYLESLRAASVPSQDVLVATKAISIGEAVTSDMIDRQRVPLAVLPEGSLRESSQAVGRVAAAAIAPRQILLEADFAGAASRLAARLPQGRWALNLPSGWLAAPPIGVVSGDRIDLLAYHPGESADQAGLIVREVIVLQVDAENETIHRLILAVTLEEAAALLVARANGFLVLGLLRPKGG